MIWFLVSVALIGGSVFFALRHATRGRLQVESVLGRMTGYGYSSDAPGGDWRSVLRQIGRVAPGGRGSSADALRLKLAAAGLSKRLSAEEAAGLKIVLPLCVYFVAVAVTAAGLVAPAIGLVGGLAAAAAAYLGLPLAIDMRIRGRRDKIVGQLPMVLDLLTLSIEAGMSFDAALQRLVRRLDGPLVDELTLMLREIQLGTSRPDALTLLAQRVDVPEVTSFVRALTQADRLGVPLAQMLRTQADELRVRLRNEAEEHAMKAPIKMLFPTVLLIFPAIFMVVLGPAMIELLDKLGN